MCKSGYHRKEAIEACSDIDECFANTHNCTATEDCVNTKGSFNCEMKSFVVSNECPFGYHRNDDADCVNNDACSVSDKLCECNKDFDDLLNCVCSFGFETNSLGRCKDIDECQLQSCGSTKEACTNVYGSHRCTAIMCDYGYELYKTNHCKRASCSPKDHKCQHRPTMVSHMFQSIRREEPYRLLFDFEANSSMNFTDFELIKFDYQHFELKTTNRGASVWLKESLKDDVELEISYKMHTRKAFKGKHLKKLFVFVSQT